ncbi:MAG: hypothetical protein A3H27_01700 [Acidobacteria bacterium RIFCSPLOWO2_02_FULL_59_13]|nr:MAG: hypothetical protein A3H27_01700 [Acidobacteria bacterium RIFCSPLOWO2_02_FULL_59_13]
MSGKQVDYIDTRWGWFLPLAILVVVLFPGAQFREIAWSAFVAAVIGMGALRLVRYRWFSFYSIVVGTHIIFYPAAVLFNLMLEWPAVRPDLWEDASWAMAGCSVGLFCLALGAYVDRKVMWRKANRQPFAGEAPPTSLYFNVAISALIPVVALFRFNLGLYYHIAVNPDYRFDMVQYLNVLEHVLWIGYCGVVLQLYRLIKTRSRLDFQVAVALVLGAILVFLPSGGRGQAFGFLPFVIIAYMTWEGRIERKLAMLAGGIVAIVSLSVTVDVYRNLTGLDTESTAAKYRILFEQAEIVAGGVADPWEGTFVGRMSDFTAAGRIIADTPGLFDYRYFDGVGNWWQIAIPKFLRPEHDELNIIEGAQVTQNYGVTDGEHTSTPVTIIGDLFSRFGWIGVCAGMFVIGMILANLDAWIFERMDAVWKICFSLLFYRLIMSLVNVSVLVAFITFTRDLLIIYLLSRCLGWIATGKVVVRQAVRREAQ